MSTSDKNCECSSPMINCVLNALEELDQHEGATPLDILHNLQTNQVASRLKLKPHNLVIHMHRALRSAVRSGHIVNVDGRYKIVCKKAVKRKQLDEDVSGTKRSLRSSQIVVEEKTPVQQRASSRVSTLRSCSSRRSKDETPVQQYDVPRASTTRSIKSKEKTPFQQYDISRASPSRSRKTRSRTAFVEVRLPETKNGSRITVTADVHCNPDGDRLPCGTTSRVEIFTAPEKKEDYECNNEECICHIKPHSRDSSPITFNKK